MEFLHVRALTEHVNDWLASTHHPCILHVFDGACNLINERRQVLSIATLRVGSGPFNIVVEDDILFSQLIDPESSISISSRHISIESLSIETKGAKLWEPRPNWEMLHSGREQILDQLAHLQIIVQQPLQIDDLFSNPLACELSSALVKQDIPKAKEIASKLAGLGIGLTPAGDDYIMGALYAAWIIHPFDVAGPLAREVAETGAPLTTSLSAAWLRSAGRGEAGILWHEFFKALISSDVQQIQFTMDNIEAGGATSGMDALAGFFTTLTAYTEWEGIACHS